MRVQSKREEEDIVFVTYENQVWSKYLYIYMYMYHITKNFRDKS